MGCHGLNAVSGLLVPDLRGSPYLHDQESWDTVVLEGILGRDDGGGGELVVAEDDIFETY